MRSIIQQHRGASEAGGRGGRRGDLCAPTRRIVRSRRVRGEAGISLLEVLVAVSILGISFAAVFSGFSAALRTTDRLDRFDQANDFAARKLSELMLDPSLAADQVRSGISASGIGWQARTQLVDTRPLFDPKRPAQLVRIMLEVSWQTRKGQQSLNLETLKLCLPEPPASP